MMSDEELLQLSNEAFCAAKDDATVRDVRLAILRKVAAHVRAMTLREAAGVCEAIRKKHMSPGERFIDPFDIGVNATGATCRDELIALAEADTTGKDGVTLEQSAQCLHEKYGDTLAKLDDNV